MSKLYPIAIQCGPDPATGLARLDLAIADGRTVSIVLDAAHARALSSRLAEVVDGRIGARPPSRRVLEIALFSADEVADTEPPRAAGAR